MDLIMLATAISTVPDVAPQPIDFATNVNIVLSVLSFLLGAISIVFVVLTLKQNNRMIEASTRPYIAISCDVVRPSPSMDKSVCYIIIKNYGSTGAVVDDITCDFPYYDNFEKTIKTINGCFLAPNQRMLYVFDKDKKISNNFATFNISYSTVDKIYNEKYILNVETEKETVRSREGAAIPYILQEIVERLL